MQTIRGTVAWSTWQLPASLKALLELILQALLELILNRGMEYVAAPLELKALSRPSWSSL